MLVRRGGKLFKHVGEVLRQTKLVQASSGIVNDYITVLKILLGSPAYCATASMEDFKGASMAARVLICVIECSLVKFPDGRRMHDGCRAPTY